MYNTDELRKISPDVLKKLEDYKSPDGRYIIPVQWVMSAYITVEADNLKDAIIAVLNDRACPLPTENTDYVDDTFEVAIDENEDAFATIDKQAGINVSEIVIHKNVD